MRRFILALLGLAAPLALHAQTSVQINALPLDGAPAATDSVPVQKAGEARPKRQTRGDLRRFDSGTTPPATCSVGDPFWDTDADTDGTLLVCRAANTWKDVDDDGTGGGGSGTVTSVATGTGLTGGPITTSGTISLGAHATQHKHGGSDEVATSTPAANAIPKAGAGAVLGTGWFGSGTGTSSNFLRGDGTWSTLPAATSGDSATGFFPGGQIEPERGGTGFNSSASTGVPRIDGGTWSVTSLPFIDAAAAPYGVIAGDGINDDTAIQAAINALPAGGGTIQLPCGVVRLGAGLTIGDGSAAAQSTKHNVKLVGCGSAVDASVMMNVGGLSGTRLEWRGSAGGTMIDFRGPMSGGGLERLTLIGDATANVAAVGVRTFHHAAATFRDVSVIGYSGTGIRIDAVGGAGLPSGVVLGGDDVVWERIYVIKPTSTSAVALDMGAATAGGAATDNARHSFTGCWFAGGTGASGRGAVLRFTDNSTFTNVYFLGGNTETAIEVVPPTGNTGFPLALSFFHGIINGNVLVTGTWAPAGDNGLWFYPLAIENGTVPADARIRGFAGNAWFGKFKVNDSGYDVDVSIEGDSDPNLLATKGSTDRVGIGTASPVSKLDVAAGGVRLAGSIVANGYDVTGYAGAGAEVGWAGSEALFSGYNRTTATYQPIVVRGSSVTLRYAGSSTGLNIDAGTGNVGVGMTGAGFKLEVNGSVGSGQDLAAAGKLQLGSLTAGSASCVAATSDRLYGDLDCDGTKDAGEEFLDQAAGVTDPIAVLDAVDEFLGNSLETGEVGTLGWTFSAQTTAYVTAVSKHPGIFSFATNTTSANIARVHLGAASTTGVILPAEVDNLQFVVRLSDLTNSKLKCGLLRDAGNTAGGTDGVYMGYDSAAGASPGNWRAVTRAASTETNTASGTAAVANAWVLFKMLRNGSGNWEFYLNGSLVTTSSTNLPTAALNPACTVETRETNAKTAEIDYFRMVGAALGNRWD